VTRRRFATGVTVVRQCADFAAQSKWRVLDLYGQAALQDLRAAGGAATHHLPVTFEDSGAQIPQQKSPPPQPTLVAITISL
jgi:hypothetical protein